MIRNVGFLSRHANIRVNETLSLIFQKLDILFVYIPCILMVLSFFKEIILNVRFGVDFVPIYRKVWELRNEV